MEIGITGHNGFIGKEVAAAVSRASHKIVPLDPFLGGDDGLQIEFKNYHFDLDWILHFASKTSIAESFKDPFVTYGNNLDSTIKAMEIAHKSNAAFLFMSSYVYGPPQYVPIDEKHPVSTTNPYMGSKIACEEICRQLCSMLNIPLIILRGFNIYGDCKIQGRIISDLVSAANNGEQIVLNDPEPLRDYLYIKDFVQLILKIISSGIDNPGIYNVGFGRSYSNLEVAQIVQKVTSSRLEIVIKSNPRKNDILDCSVDVDLVKKKFCWKPSFDLEQGLKELIHLTV